MNLSRTFLWRKLRERKILATHRRVAAVCEDLIERYQAEPVHFDLSPKKDFGTQKIIWQYWAQGYEEVPPVIRQCLDSVEKYAGDYTLVRLTDANLSEYLDLPEFVQLKRGQYSLAHFSDLLRLILLQIYGGIWMDATIMMSGPIPEEWARLPFFVFRRDPQEPNYRYWRNTYAYYFGWAPGFRVNMLNSFIIAQKGGNTISDLCDLMLLWWKNHDDVPDYFFFQILCDVYGYRDDFPLVSDTRPHYLQQVINDPSFSLLSKENIIRLYPLHKMTNKNR